MPFRFTSINSQKFYYLGHVTEKQVIDSCHSRQTLAHDVCRVDGGDTQQLLAAVTVAGAVTTRVLHVAGVTGVAVAAHVNHRHCAHTAASQITHYTVIQRRHRRKLGHTPVSNEATWHMRKKMLGEKNISEQKIFL